jgi:hypothetical protein
LQGERFGQSDPLKSSDGYAYMTGDASINSVYGRVADHSETDEDNVRWAWTISRGVCGKQRRRCDMFAGC